MKSLNTLSLLFSNALVHCTAVDIYTKCWRWGSHFIKTSLLFSTIFAHQAVFALPEDRSKQVHITSKSATIDRDSGSLTYIGEVVVTQGTLIIKADRLVLIKENGGLRKIIATGKPAYFKDVIEASQGPTEAFGQRMEYDDLKRTLEITGKARVRREGDEFMGEKIQYLLDESKLAATGGESKDGSDEHIQMIIQPRNIK